MLRCVVFKIIKKFSSTNTPKLTTSKYLREQNLQLKAENERLKQGRQHGSEHSEHGHGVSSTSWSEVGGDGSSTLNGAGHEGLQYSSQKQAARWGI